MCIHYCDVIITAMASQITCFTVVYWTVYSGAYKKGIKGPRHWPLCEGNSPVISCLHRMLFCKKSYCKEIFPSQQPWYLHKMRATSAVAFMILSGNFLNTLCNTIPAYPPSSQPPHMTACPLDMHTCSACIYYTTRLAYVSHTVCPHFTCWVIPE